MKLFAVETSTERLSLAILRDGRIIERDVFAGQRHSDLALPLMRELFMEAGLTAAELDAIAFGQGPGSFTGVRVACGLAQGMSLGAKVGLLPLPTTMLLAEQSDAPRVCVALDARMNEIYFAAYERDAAQSCGWRAVVAPTLAKPDDLPALAGGGWTGIGSAFGHEPLRGVLLKRLGACLAATLDDAHPRAREALVIGARALVGGGMSLLVPAREASPLYVRNDVALTLKERAAARAEADA